MNFLSKCAGKLAVITGAASGIGLALAEYCDQLGMRLVLIDIEASTLQELEGKFVDSNKKPLLFCADVRDFVRIETIAEEVNQTLGPVDFLFNNAGVGGPMMMSWELPLEKLQWVMDVNFYGTIHGIKAFLPKMLNASDGQRRFIINIASMAGLYSAPYLSAYEAAKHAVVAFTEALFHDLKTREANIQTAIACPGWIKTQILNDVRNDSNPTPLHKFYENCTFDDAMWISNFARRVKAGMAPAEVARIIFEGIAQGKFYIFTHPEMKSCVEERARAILDEKEPSSLFEALAGK